MCVTKVFKFLSKVKIFKILTKNSTKIYIDRLIDFFLR